MPDKGLLTRLYGRYVEESITRHVGGRLTGPDRPKSIAVGYDEVGLQSDVRLERHPQGYRIVFQQGASPYFVRSKRLDLEAYLFWFHHCPPTVAYMTVNATDGDMPSDACFTPSGVAGRIVPIPDPHFFRDRGFDVWRALGAKADPWTSRSDTLVWRGGGNGFGRLSFDRADERDPTIMQRWRMVMTLFDQPGCDVRLSHFCQAWASWTAVAKQRGYLAEHIAEESWLHRKYAIDIDGFSNTWSNLLVRMLLGCCVIKVASAFGFEQWYYPRMRPFEHFVPVKADLTDLVEKIDWVRSNQREAQRIAEEGRRFAEKLDFQAGLADAVSLITANWSRPTVRGHTSGVP
jgi:hypothetical protein